MKKLVISSMIIFISIFCCISCALPNTGVITPFFNALETQRKVSNFTNKDIGLDNTKTIEFQYSWDYPTPFISVWLELYEEDTFTEEPISISTDNNKGRAGSIYFMAHNFDLANPWWTLGLSNMHNGNVKADFKDSEQKINSFAYNKLLIPKDEILLSPANETILLAIVYADSPINTDITFEEIRSGIAWKEGVEMVLVLKCMFSDGRIDL